MIMMIGREMTKSAGNILDDIDSNVSFKAALQNRGREALDNLKTRAIDSLSGQDINQRNIVNALS